jgi:hypothetical protein
MLRTVGGGEPTLWESILPSAVLGMPGEVERVDRLLDDPRFVEPYRACGVSKPDTAGDQHSRVAVGAAIDARACGCPTSPSAPDRRLFVRGARNLT